MSVDAEADRLEAAARGGRVAHSGFLPEAASSALRARLARAGIAASAWGGVPAASRRVVTARPEHVPEARAPLHGLYLEGVFDDAEVRARLRTAGADEARLGDAVRHRDGLGLVVAGEPPADWLGPFELRGVRVVPQPVPVDRLAAGSTKRLSVVVPSLRADVVGAKAFGASRSWFAKGVAGGKVRVDGEPAGKSASLEEGSELWAEGLGRATLVEVTGETKRGNLKAVLEVEKP